MAAVAVWGGVECTVNRVADRWHDQLQLSGHDCRLQDLERIRELGIRTLRYPVIWERTAPNSPDERDWRWADERLAALRSLGIEPIVGLVHHGSGPRYTGLLEDNFATELARFAGDCAARYPWVKRYTPVNEPLTTARFSALYGHWYPHHRNERSFVRALLNQCRAIAMSMSAIRAVNPAAELVQTEDLGTTYSTEHMAYQRRFDNERRWLSWDILCGRMDERHPLRPFLQRAGATDEELDWFLAHPCPPQILGINHYVTSDRYLDERLDHYPAHVHGGNGRERYADVEAVRVLGGAYPGWDIIKTTWERYHLPVAVTEVHLGCTREEQLRWFRGAWLAAGKARFEGCDVRAVTAWSLFGAFNWNTLLTRTDGHYEPGAFDVRAPEPRPTALARLIQATIEDQGPPAAHYCLPGWWQRPERVLYRATEARAVDEARRRRNAARPLLICGARGSLGRELSYACQARGLPFRALARSELDITDPSAVEAALDALKPWAVVNAAGFVRVDDAERHGLECFRDNVRGCEALVAAADRRNIQLVTFSSDLVFDGQRSTPYVESSATNPLNAYGRSKLACEVVTLRSPTAMCVRTAAFFSDRMHSDFLSDALRSLASGRAVVALEDVTISPTYVPDLANACLDLLIDGCTGLVHLANRGALSWAEFLEHGARALDIDAAGIVRRRLSAAALAAPRPRYSALASERFYVMPTLEDAIERYCRAAGAALATAASTYRASSRA